MEDYGSRLRDADWSFGLRMGRLLGRGVARFHAFRNPVRVDGCADLLGAIDDSAIPMGG